MNERTSAEYHEQNSSIIQPCFRSISNTNEDRLQSAVLRSPTHLFHLVALCHVLVKGFRWWLVVVQEEFLVTNKTEHDKYFENQEAGAVEI